MDWIDWPLHVKFAKFPLCVWRLYSASLLHVLSRINRFTGGGLFKVISKNVLHSEDFLRHYKGRPSNNLFELFLKLKGRPEENSNCFSNVEPCTITCTLDTFIKY